MRFGVQVRGEGQTSAAAWTELARRVEGAGFSTLLMPDHFGEQLAPVPALMAAAAVTTTLRVGAFVFDNDYRHPSMLAKELATMDVLSDGRLEIGMGAGWAEQEYRQAGMPFDRAGVRIERMVEGVQVVKGLLGSGPFTFAGDHYRITDMDGWPEPAQQPPPLMIGGTGPRVLGIAARHADIVGINVDLSSPEANTDDGLAQRVALVQQAAGDRLDGLELNLTILGAVITDDLDAGARRAGEWLRLGPERVLTSPHFLVGPKAKLVERVHELRERFGLTYFVGTAHTALDTLSELLPELV
jgi:probable F420-dependent oxidoreductase